MKNFLLRLFLIIPILWTTFISGVEIPVSINSIQGEGRTLPHQYVSCLISNGSISFGLNAHGNMEEGIYRAGRRSSHPGFTLLKFGTLTQSLELDGKSHTIADKWTQTLDVQKGYGYCEGTFPGIVQTISILTPLERDVIAIRRTLRSTSKSPQKVKVQLKFLVAPTSQGKLLETMQGSWTFSPQKPLALFDYTFFGYPVSRGRISLFSPSALLGEIKDNRIDLSVELTLQPGESRDVDFFVHFEDSIDGKDWKARSEKAVREIRDLGFASLFERNVQAWNSYYSQSLVDIPDVAIQRMYNTGQYHLRANATRWSFPVGISPRLWNGRFFGWDEMFCHQGILTSNHLAIAQRCPDFRKAILKVAQYRVAHYGKPGKYGARYVWEALEDGSEGAPPGFWSDHIFHISNIARSAWTQFLYNDDWDYLKSTGYPLVLECARYFRSHWIYTDSNGEMYIGKCTDLERLGPAKDHPFMTTCGAIYTLRAAATAAELLNQNPDEAADFRKTADKLIESLPQRNGAYIGYPDCPEPTVATLGGLFPYDIFDASNSLQKKAAYSFIREGRANGNMYPVGNSVCPWYTGKMATAMTLLDDRQEPVKLMKEAAGTVGYFGQLYEINEKNVSKNPWFTTAAGNCVYAVNQMLIHCKKDVVHLMSGMPTDWKDCQFKLPAFGGLLFDVALNKGRLTRLTITPIHPDREYSRTIILNSDCTEGVTWNKSVVKHETKEGKTRLTVVIKGKSVPLVDE